MNNQFFGRFQINDYEAIAQSLSLQVTAKVAPERFNLEWDFVPKNGNEAHILSLLEKYHPGQAKWRKSN